MPFLTEGSIITVPVRTIPAKPYERSNLVTDITYPAGATYVAASADASHGTVNVGGTQWTIVTLPANTAATLEVQFEITDDTAFYAGDKTVTFELAAAGGEVELGNNTATYVLEGFTCQDVRDCVAETAPLTYHARLTQATTGNPSAVLLQPNTLGESPTLTRDAEGVYFIDTVGTVFTADKTSVQVTLAPGATAKLVEAGRTSDTRVTINTFAITGLADDLDGVIEIEIRVYP